MNYSFLNTAYQAGIVRIIHPLSPGLELGFISAECRGILFAELWVYLNWGLIW